MAIIKRNIGRVLGLIRAESRQLSNRYFGKIERFEGNAEEICRQIVAKLWRGDFFKTSLGHFDFFWMRDFGTVAESLTKIGYKKHVLHTLRWALTNYRESDTITTCIDKYGRCFNAPTMAAIDTLPWLLHSLVVSGYDLSPKERRFLEKQLARYNAKFLDTTGHIKPMKYAEMRDAVIYDRSAYAVSLVGRLAWCVEQLDLKGFPHQLAKYQSQLIKRYWNGSYFNADRQTEAFSAECALMPFFLGVIQDEALWKSTLGYIQDNQYNQPFPLVYNQESAKFKYHWWMTAPWMPEYEGNTLWSWHGMFYLHSLRRFSSVEFQAERQAFASGMIEQHGNFPEMLNLDGSWYKAPVYMSDPGMVWAALYVDLATLDHADQIIHE